jgi:hypothetical protein
MVSSTKDFVRSVDQLGLQQIDICAPAVFKSDNLLRCGRINQVSWPESYWVSIYFCTSNHLSVSCLTSFLHSLVLMAVHLLASFLSVYYRSGRVVICWLPLYSLCHFTAAFNNSSRRIKISPIEPPLYWHRYSTWTFMMFSPSESIETRRV